MSHEFLQEIYEKEKKNYQTFPVIFSKSGVSSTYMSKRKLTQKTDKFVKSISFSNRKPAEIHETELLSIKSTTTKGRAVADEEKKMIRMRKIRYINHRSQHNETKQMETKMLNPFQTSYEDHYTNQPKIKWIPKRYGSNKIERNFSQNVYNQEGNATIYEANLTKPEIQETNKKKLKPEESSILSPNDLNKESNNCEPIEKLNEKIEQDDRNKINDEVIDGENNCIYNEIKPLMKIGISEKEGEAKILKPLLSKTEYFKILNIGFQHLKNYKLPLEKLNEIIKENEDYFRHLGGILKKMFF